MKYYICRQNNSGYAKVEYAKKYYKYMDRNFNQPLLKSNGEIGGEIFAVKADSEQSKSNQIWQAFDQTYETIWISDFVGKNYIIFYNPLKINLKKITISNYQWSQYLMLSGSIYASNDNVQYTKLIDFKGNTTANAVWDIDLSDNNEFYNYYKLDCTNASNALEVREFKLEGEEREIIVSDEKDYDFYTKIPKLKLFKEKEKEEEWS